METPTTTVVVASVATAPIVFSPTKAELARMAAECAGLTIAGPDDRKGYDLVRESRLRLMRTRVAIDKTRKDLKADALEFGRRVDAAAKELTALIEPTERVLEAEEVRIDTERARLKAEAEAARKAKLDGRVAAFAAVGCQVAPSVVEALSDEEYEGQLTVATVEHAERVEAARLELERIAREEVERKAAEEAARKAEADRLAAERAENERVAAEQRAAQAKLDAERRAFEAEQARVRQAQIDADAKARFEADAARARSEREAAEKAEAARIEALRPQAERVEMFASMVEALAVPDVAVAGQIRAVLARAAAEIRGVAWKGAQA